MKLNTLCAIQGGTLECATFSMRYGAA
jgi:hypothetical protein